MANDAKLQYWEEVLVRMRLAMKNKKYGTTQNPWKITILSTILSDFDPVL
jgi:hypothetical protein